jgi:hypothetical protein
MEGLTSRTACAHYLRCPSVDVLSWGVYKALYHNQGMESTRSAAKIYEKIQFPRSATEFRLNISMDVSLKDVCE